MTDWVLHQGHILDVLAAMDAESVNCIVTSPPYWSLRKYDAEDTTWGGSPGCEHDFETKIRTGEVRKNEALKNMDGDGSHPRQSSPEAFEKVAYELATCSRCGAWRGQYGLEPVPWCWRFDEPCGACYVCHTRQVWAALRRVLRRDGVMWWNIGTGYAGSNGTGGGPGDKQFTNVGSRKPATGKVTGFKPKDLIPMHAILELAAIHDGWWLRSEIIWAKPNAMPESVRDRPTDAHEYVLLLAKSKTYWWDQEAVREPHTSIERLNGKEPKFAPHQWLPEGNGYNHNRAGGDGVGYAAAGRNIRTVWTFPTAQKPAAHFATFPEELPRRAILASCPPVGKRCDCDEIIETPLGSGPSEDPTMLTGRGGLNRVRRDDEGTRPITRREQRWHAQQLRGNDAAAEASGAAFAHYIRTDASGARPLPEPLRRDFMERGWISDAPPCEHPIEPAGTVLDPFAGTATTGVVALRLGRRFVGIELSEKYAEMARAKLDLYWRDDRVSLAAPASSEQGALAL